MGQCCADARPPTTVEGTEDDQKDLRGIIVWSASGFGGDLQNGKPYVIVRLDDADKQWKEKARSNGRRSEPASWPDPSWKLGFAVSVANISKPEVHIRLYTTHVFGDPENYVDEVRVPVSTLEARSTEPQTLKFAKSGGSLKLSFGPVSILQEQGVKPSELYEKLAPVGKQTSVKVDDVNGDGPFLIGKDPLPKALRGVFWLSDQGNLSALATFGGPNRDGAGCSVGRLEGNEYKIRVAGDRTWAGAEPYRLLDKLDIVYHFIFDSAENPTHVQIYPESVLIGATLTNEWLLDFEAKLLPEGSPVYPGSVVWERESWVFGINSTYQLVQVIDEDGKRIEPAWTKFAAYQNSPVAGSSPGVLHYYTRE